MTFFFLDLLIVIASFITLFRGFWAFRRRALPSRTARQAAVPEPGCRPALRLVASTEEGLGTKAVTIACVGTTEELECLLRALDRRATLKLVREKDGSQDADK